MPRGTTHGVGAQCNNCGYVSAHYEASGRLRCDECGQFCQASENYCAKHDCRIDKVTGYNRCPMCAEEDRVNRREQEMQARRSNPRMHTSVDARRF